MIEISNAAFAYDKETVFENLNLTIEEGQITCLFGPNGCGKSTLIQCLLGIYPLSAGKIHIRGKDLATMKAPAIAREAAYIPQVHDKPFSFKVIDVVLMGRAAYTGMFSLPSEEDRTIAEEALEKVGMTDFIDRPYTQLSGGETQLILVARALAQQTPILIMDEPTSHLDFRNELAFLETTVRLVKTTGITVVMATHAPNHAFYFEGAGADTRIAIMNNKSITMTGKPADVLTEQTMNSTFDIESRLLPYTWENRDMKEIVPLKLNGHKRKENDR